MKTTGQKNQLFKSVIAAMLLFNVSCKTTDRAAQVGDGTASVHIELSNLEDPDVGQSDYVYTASGCGTDEVTPGKLMEQTKIEFMIKAIKPGQYCHIRIENPRADLSSIRFNTQDQVLYEAPQVAITADAQGQLVGNAILKRQYHHILPEDAQKRFSLSVPVLFPESLDFGAEAQLICNPDLAVFASSFKADLENSGQFTFGAIVQPAIQAHVCDEIQIFKESKLVYQANLNDGQGLQIVAEPGRILSVSQTPLALKAVSFEEAAGVVVHTKKGDCAVGEVFNTATRVCQPAL